MKKNILRICFFVGTILFIIGVVILFRAVDMGMGQMYEVVTKAGHSFEQSRLDMIAEQAIKNFRIMGTITSIVGGSVAILFGYQWFKSM